MKEMPFLKIIDSLDAKQKNILIISVLLILSIMISYNIIYKKATMRAASYTRIAAEETKRNSLFKSLNELDQAKSKYEKILLQKTDIDIFKSQMAGMASQAGARLVSIKSSRSQAGHGYIVFLTDIELECTYHQLGDLIAKIENTEPLIFIKNIKFTNVISQNLFSGRRKISTGKINIEKGDTKAETHLIIETYSKKTD